MKYVKGQSGNPAGKPKGAKNRTTLLKEERRAIFDAEISKKWLQTIQDLKAEYVADQFMGKAPEESNVHIEEVVKLTPELEALKKEFEDKVKKKL